MLVSTGVEGETLKRGKSAITSPTWQAIPQTAPCHKVCANYQQLSQASRHRSKPRQQRHNQILGQTPHCAPARKHTPTAQSKTAAMKACYLNNIFAI
jgi:hypothetical protein